MFGAQGRTEPGRPTPAYRPALLVSDECESPACPAGRLYPDQANPGICADAVLQVDRDPIESRQVWPGDFKLDVSRLPTDQRRHTDRHDGVWQAGEPLSRRR